MSLLLKPNLNFASFLALALSLFSLHCAFAAPVRKTAVKQAKSENLVPCLELIQVSRAYGTVKFYIAADRFRMEQMPSGIVFTCCAPDLELYSINNQTHTYYAANSSTTALTMQRALLLEGVDLSKVKWRSVEKDKIESLDAERLIDVKANAQASNKPLKRGYENFDDELRERGFWVASQLPVNPALANKVAQINASPQVGKVPLRFIHISPATKRVTAIETRAVKKTTLDASLFLPPKGYKKTLSEFDSNVKEGDIMGALGAAPEDLDKKKKK